MLLGFNLRFLLKKIRIAHFGFGIFYMVLLYSANEAFHLVHSERDKKHVIRLFVMATILDLQDGFF